MDFQIVAEVFDKLSKTTKRGEKTLLVSRLLKQTKPELLNQIILLLQGRILPHNDTRNLGVSSQLLLKALERATGYTKKEITDLWKKQGDLGLVAYELKLKPKQQTLFTQTLTVEIVTANLQKILQIEGNNSVDTKVALIAELLTYASALESQYVARLVLEVMRVGVGDAVVRDAIVWAYFPAVDYLFEKQNDEFIPTLITDTKGGILESDSVQEVKSNYPIESYNLSVKVFHVENEQEARIIYNNLCSIVQRALDFTNDLGYAAELAAKRDVLVFLSIKPTYRQPIQVMLAKKAVDFTDALTTTGTPALCEYKYDGFRMQIHKFGNQVTLYTRKLEDVTTQFPEVVEFILKHVTAIKCILDSEAVGFDRATNKYTAFQQISQRIRRKYDIAELSQKLPVEVNIFDIIMLNDEVLIEKPLSERRKHIENLIPTIDKKIRPSKAIICTTEDELSQFYDEALKCGNEGVMVKSLDAPYKPGSRVGYMVKLKPIMDTLDLVITKATWGEGKRANYLTSFVVSCITEDGELKELGRVGTGFKELTSEDELLSFEAMTNLLKPLIIAEKAMDVEIKPQILLQIAFEEIQKSPTYSSGFALRFPRVVSLLDTRSVDDASSLTQVEDFYYQQQTGRDR